MIRYHALDRIGIGGMSVVFRARDRLTDDIIALKNLHLDDRLALMPASYQADLRLALVREFQLMAGLRHPHIAKVFDFGFTESEQQPFFAMELLEDAPTIVEAYQGRPLSKQINGIIQMLHALNYLHRRNIIHHDIKPSNVLVEDDTVKLLDFGLATQTGQVSSEGTLTYMAPEVIAGRPASQASDLYAVGVLIYEILTGNLPVYDANVEQFMQAIQQQEPDLSPLPRDLRAVVGRLLAKDPTTRYQQATEVIKDLGYPVETEATRESFLQASTFVGREQELGQLITALDQLIEGEGSTWLVGGESGGGKSRLLDEVRIRALTRGAVVLRGEGLENGGVPYQIWRTPLRRLILSVDVSDLEAGIIKALLPDIEDLIERPVLDAPELNPAASQKRLIATIVEVFRRQATHTPTVLLVEDLHWTVESLLPLHALVEAGLPIMIVGSYRSDEKPDLPEQLPASMGHIPLPRLTDDDVAQLVASMIGEAGQRPEVLSLVQRETEGNVFFMVEVIRALAEEAGQLSTIGAGDLPDRVMAGGMRTLLRRRLERVPEAHQSTLARAAVAGRTLDPPVLAHLVEDDLDEFVAACANVAVIERLDEQWRFAHDKLRDALLADLPAEHLQAYHAQVAEAHERAYPDNPDYALTLAKHWLDAHQVEQAYPYVVTAGRQMILVSNYQEAESLITRCMDDLPADQPAWASHLHKLLGDIADQTSRYDQAVAYYQQSLAEATTDAQRAAARLGMGITMWRRSDYPTAVEHLEAVLDLSDDTHTRAEALRHIGVTYLWQSEYEDARRYFEQALALCRSIDDEAGMASNLNNLGAIGNYMRDHEQAEAYFTQALDIMRRLGDQRAVAILLNNLGVILRRRKALDQAIANWQEALTINRAIGEQSNIAMNLGNLAFTYTRLGELPRAQAYIEESLAIRQRIGDKRGMASAYNNLGHVKQKLGHLDEALEYYNQSLVLSRDMNNKHALVNTLFRKVECLIDAGRHQETYPSLIEALTTAQVVKSDGQMANVMGQAIRLVQYEGDEATARHWFGAIADIDSDETDFLHGTIEPADAPPTLSQAMDEAVARWS